MLKTPNDMNIKKIINTVICGNALTELKKIPNNCIDTIITSTPYWGLRNYHTEPQIWDEDENCQHEWNDNLVVKRSGGGNSGKISHNTICHFENISNFCSKCGAWKGSLGLELNFDSFLSHLYQIFDECKRILKKTGSCWVVLSDTYAGSGNGSWNAPIEQRGKQYRKTCNIDQEYLAPPIRNNTLPDKCLCLIPQRFAIGMCERGWTLRNDIIWEKPNSLPSSVVDRFSVNYEHIFFFVKNKKYYFEQQFEPLQVSTLLRAKYNSYSEKTDMGLSGGMDLEGQKKIFKKMLDPNYPGRNMRAIWNVSTQSFSDNHYAVFPQKLVKNMILAGCPEFVCAKCNKPRTKVIERQGLSSADYPSNKDKSTYLSEQGQKQNLRGPREAYKRQIVDKGYISCNCGVEFEPGICLDPFMGAGTTGLVARKLNRNFIGIELSQSYTDMAEKRLKNELGLFY